MRIINTNTPSFGYNKEYHKQLHQELNNRKQYKGIAQNLIDFDTFSMSLEDKIGELEKSKKTKTEEYSALVDTIIDIRKSFTTTIQYYFPKLNYAQNASKEYVKESRDVNAELAKLWREEVSYEIEQRSKDVEETKKILRQKNGKMNFDFASLSEQEQLELLNQINKMIDEKSAQERNITKKSPQTATDAQTADIQFKFIDEYKPNQFSPKGFCDVANMEDIKTKLQEEIVDYIKNPQQAAADYEEYGIRAPRGYILYGPPGCGKTFITSALAQEADTKMFTMDLSKIGTKFINETSNNIQREFDNLEKYVNRTGKPVILFMDEVDSLAGKRMEAGDGGENVKTVATLLKNVEGARDKGIIVICATNRFDNLDAAFKSRFDSQIYIGLPSQEQISKLLPMLLQKRQKGQELAQDKEAIEQISKKLTGYSNRSISFIVDEASKIAKRDNRSSIKAQHLNQAIETCELEKPNEGEYRKKGKNTKIGFAPFSV